MKREPLPFLKLVGIQPIEKSQTSRHSTHVKKKLSPVKSAVALPQFQNAIQGWNFSTAGATQRKKIVSIPSASNLGQIHPQIQNQFFALKIIVESNYGSPTDISCSEIDALDGQNCKLPVFSITFEPPLIHHSSPELLVNNQLIKAENQPEWSASWQGQVAIILTISAPKPPASLRIWNSRDQSPSNVKDIRVVIGDTYITSACIPQKFGLIVSLSALDKFSDFQKNLAMHEQAPDNIATIDSYGEIFVPQVYSISFQILKTFSNSEYIGLDGIEIYTTDGSLVTLDREIFRVFVDNLETVSSACRCFREDRRIDGTVGEGFIAKYVKGSTEPPTINVKFKKAISIALIRIANVKRQTFTSNFAVKHMKIFFNEDPNNIGFLGGLSLRSMDVMKNLWFVDSLPIRMKIRSSIPHVHQLTKQEPFA